MDATTLQKLQALQNHTQTWLKSYESGNFAKTNPEMAIEAAEMRKLLAKTEQLLAAGSPQGWQQAYQQLEQAVKGEPFFANCFGNADDALQMGLPIGAALLALAGNVKALAENWYGQYFDGQEAPETTKATVATIYERAKEILSAPKNTATAAALSIRFFGATTGDSRKLGQLLDTLAGDFAGKINIEKFEDKGDGAFRTTYKIEQLPTLIFLREGKEIARHIGEISQSELLPKMNLMVEGANFSDSGKSASLDNQRTISDRELFSLGEFVVLYFDTVWSGICKKMGNIVKEEVMTLATKTTKTTNIRYEQITIDGKTHIHKKFQVDKVPTIVYLRDGQAVGKQEGYVNPSTLKESMRRFLANGSVDDSTSNEFDLLGVVYSKAQASSEQVASNIPSKLSGSVGQGGKNEQQDVYAIQILLTQHGFGLVADGQCDSAVVKAIIDFQAANRLEPTGLIEPHGDTWAALLNK